MVIYIIGMIQVSDKTYIILGIVYGAVAIILIVVVLVLINKHNKKQYEEILSKLERNKNLIISGNILTELNKVSSLINNKELEKKYESWQKRYKQIKDVDIPSLTNELNDLDELIKTKKRKAINEASAKLELEIYYVKAKSEFLLKEIREISLSETKNREIVNKLNIPVYNEDKHSGVLRHVVGRVGKKGDIMVVIVTASDKMPREKEFVKMLRAKLPKVVSIQQNIQTYRNNVIMGRDTKLLWGKPTILDNIGRLSFHISPRSFFQVNTEQAEVLYNKALEFADLHGEETVIDAYCGTGTITLFLAQKAREVYGIEIVKPAIQDAKKNARDNNVRNAEFIVGDATVIMPKLYRQGIRANVVVVDPPRAGCTEVVLETFANMKPEKIVYVSCNPASLARDMGVLAKLGYKAKKVQPVDMFPNTSHVETVCLMSRKI